MWGKSPRARIWTGATLKVEDFKISPQLFQLSCLHADRDGKTERNLDTCRQTLSIIISGTVSDKNNWEKPFDQLIYHKTLNANNNYTKCHRHRVEIVLQTWRAGWQLQSARTACWRQVCWRRADAVTRWHQIQHLQANAVRRCIDLSTPANNHCQMQCYVSITYYILMLVLLLLQNLIDTTM